MPELGGDLLDLVDDLRGIPGELGLRPYKVSVVVRTWSGSRPGVDASTSSDAPKVIGVDVGTQSPRVRQLTQREIIASGGAYNDQDLKIGPLTPPFVVTGDAPYQGATADNSSANIFDPPTQIAATEVFFKIEGRNMPAGGRWYKKIGQDLTRPLHYEFTVRNTGETP